MKSTYRSNTAFVFGWIWVAFVAINAVDLMLRYTGRSSLVAGAVLGALTAIVYVTALRPGTVLGEEGLRVRNPFRTWSLPWASVDGVRVSHSIAVDYADGKVLRLWTPTASARERAKATRRGVPKGQRGGLLRTEAVRTKAEQMAAEALAGKTHADWVGDQIVERSEAARRRDQAPPPVRATWAIDALAACALAIALVAAAILV